MREKATGYVIAAGVALIVLPAVVIACALYWRAWARGWPPTRGRWVAAASWLLPVGVWLTGPGPVELTDHALAAVETSRWWMAWLPMLPWMIPLGTTLGSIYWGVRWHDARSGRFRNPRAAGVWGPRQWAHAMKRARAEARRPGLVPLLTRHRDLVIGRAAEIVEAGAGHMVPRDPRKLVVPASAIAKHLVVIGEPGVGKTVLLTRLVTADLGGAWLGHVVDGRPRPLTIVLNCKGGDDGKVIEQQLTSAFEAMGIPRNRIGVWPREVRLDLWHLPPNRLVEVLVEMVKTDHPYYADVQDEAVSLAVLAPGGPPGSSVEFIRRLNTEWLLNAYDARFPGERESIKQLRQEFAGVASRYRTTFRRLGRTLDSGRSLDDFDAVVATVEGTENVRTASAMAQALVELVTDLATRGGHGGRRRRVLFTIDEYSAVSERVQVSLLMERARSLGVSVVAAGQSWASMGPTDDERKRLISAASGGMLLMATADPEQLAKLSGSRLNVEVGIKKLDSGGYGDEGTGRVQNAYLVDPDRLRMSGTTYGQVVYVSHGVATWGAVASVATTTAAPALPAPGTRVEDMIAYVQRGTITRGERIPAAELDAGLADLDDTAGMDSDTAFEQGVTYDEG